MQEQVCEMGEPSTKLVAEFAKIQMDHAVAV
jgi:hypothetical protein